MSYPTGHRGSVAGQSKETPALHQSWSDHPNTPLLALLARAHQLPALRSCKGSRGRGVAAPAKAWLPWQCGD